MTLRGLVESRIRAGVADFKEVAGASDLHTILAAAVNAPGCYVYRERNRAGPNGMVNIVSQQRAEFVGLALVTHSVRDAMGGDNSDECGRLCDLVQAQLLGFVPGEAYTAMEYVAGDFVLARDGFSFWREIYQSARLIRSV